MRKPKAEVSENWAGEEETSQSDSSAGQSTLEISGPTIPSPGPSGTCHMNQLLSSMCSTQHRTFLETGVCVCVFCRKVEGLQQSGLARTGGVSAHTAGRPHYCGKHLAGCVCQKYRVCLFIGFNLYIHIF